MNAKMKLFDAKINLLKRLQKDKKFPQDETTSEIDKACDTIKVTNVWESCFPSPRYN